MLCASNPARAFSSSLRFIRRTASSSMASAAAASSSSKKLIRIDISSDTVCPFCFVGKTNLDKAMDQTKDVYDFEVRWHPFLLDPDAPKAGVKKSDYYARRFGPAGAARAASRMTDIFRGLGMSYDMDGLTGSTLDSHRLIALAGQQGLSKQHALVGELFLNYFCQGKFIGDRQVLLEAARKVGVEQAEELLDDPKKGLDQVTEELKAYSASISGVPFYRLNGKISLSGAQPPEAFQQAFEAAAATA